jgi:hypothetical protein
MVVAESFGSVELCPLNWKEMGIEIADDGDHHFPSPRCTQPSRQVFETMALLLLVASGRKATIDA